MSPAAPLEERVLIRAPVGADAFNTGRVLEKGGFGTVNCTSLDDMADKLEEGCGALLLTEEAVIRNDVERLRETLQNQPKWSDVPIILITSGGHTTAASTTAVNLLGAQSNVTLTERPLRTVTLVAVLTSALRSRRRQYEVRNLIAERDELLASLESRVRERTARLQQIVEELESFSYSVSHDLRAPLRALDAYAQALLEDCGDALSADARGYAEKIARSAQRMDHLTQDLLTYTRVSRHGVPLKRVELDTLLHDVLHTYPSITRWTEQITVRRPLPAVLGHAPSLMQCFSNLLDNAFKFTSPLRPPRVTVRAEPAGERSVRVVVEDNGIGIDPAHHERIFGIFERVTSSTEGTGIGLAIVRRAVERMGGRVGVESTPGQGAQFWLELPLARPEPGQPVPHPRPAAGPPAPREDELAWSRAGSDSA
jgi:signal transduction histidine kinase